jgi:hypothetical protein
VEEAHHSRTDNRVRGVPPLTNVSYRCDPRHVARAGNGVYRAPLVD